ncbi:conserved hypothetical protein [Vibrio nigripulchritudo SO65]|uniref:YccT family protein n=1 Tax=Vibrio nigripulchritudo TaxID=28173 RepID=UPI0003B20A3B|nr:DUF2057 domain-containing protein [Vibrio nigripulchritudo]CCN36886.1 conserved hypothetical protein [Vibrio nigripulchritudo AM115]CCN42553.1 conserved hypothetical protein [Vibrio nigripulchritudo FTn2]CCN63861.1 conserved hypothetical protein [Vibrio nigripulchritudo POn4]CCN74734.1 conserved hypothetical protein [Vibrio nigripulchritudo SO65]
MKFRNTFIIPLAMCFSTFLSAAQLELKPGVDLLVLNGMESSEFEEGFKLSEGTNQAVVKMSKSFGSGGSKDIFTSSPYIVSFQASGKDITIAHPKVYSVQHARNLFNKNPQWLVYEDGDLIDSETVFLEGKGGFVPYWDVKALVRDYNEKNGITFAAMSAGTVAVAEVKSATKSKAVTSEKVDASQALSQLQAWYLKASKEERKAFRKWMIDQE